MSEQSAISAPGIFLPWDSEFFGLRIGRAQAYRLSPTSLSALLAWSKAEEIRCLYFSADPTCPTTLALAHEGGFQFVDLRLDLSLKLQDAPPSAGSQFPALPEATPAQLPDLEAIARVAHTNTRFFKDQGFPAERSADLYAEWIRRDYRMHKIFVGANPSNGKPAGYITCQVDSATRSGRIGLIAVDAPATGRGLGRTLVGGALRWFHDQGCAEVSVATQGSNVAAQRLYQSAGFRSKESSVWFHRWF